MFIVFNRSHVIRISSLVLRPICSHAYFMCK